MVIMIQVVDIYASAFSSCNPDSVSYTRQSTRRGEESPNSGEHMAEL
jgi:hypothetical protein